MIGTNRIEILIEHKEKLYEKSLAFAKFDSPDFIIMKEAMLGFNKMIRYQVGKAKDITTSLTEDDKKYMFAMVSVVGKNFGTNDLEWFCATETVLNTLFDTKSRNAHEYAKLFIDQILRKMFRTRAVEEVNELR
jgi:hypothetical protein